MMAMVYKYKVALILAALAIIVKEYNVSAFSSPSPVIFQKSHVNPSLKAFQMSSQTRDQVLSNITPTAEWELDCYSRPVLVDGKKLWEVLITDSTGQFRLCEALPSNRVNSRELRRVIEDAIDEAEVKPNTIRFFRGAMFNMINIALSEVEVVARPSRCTFALASWLEERNREVYPKMEG